MADNIDVVTYSGLGRFKSQADALYGKVKSIQGLSPDNNGNVNIPEATDAKSGLMSSDDKNTISNLKSVATSGSYNDLSNKPTKLSEFENDITIGIGKLDFSMSDWVNNNSIYTLSKTIGTAKFINLYRELNGSYQVICADNIVIASTTLTITSPEPFNGFILVSSTEAFDESSVEELESVINNNISNLSQDIIPNESSTISLGSAEKKFAAVYADEVHISQNTLYIGDTPVLGTDEDTINIKADIDQSVLVKTTGTGTTQMSSENGILLRTNGTTANININADGTNSEVTMNAKTRVSLTAPNIVIDGATTIKDLTVTGTTTTVNSTNLAVKDNLIELNSGETGNGVTAGTAGIKVNRGDELPYLIQFDEADDRFKVGKQGSLETIATQDYVDEAVSNVTFEHPETHPASMITGLATVATSGSYNDLSNKPTIPTSLPANGGNASTVNGHTVESNVPANAVFTDTKYTHPSTHAASMITGLANVATSGNYNDLNNTPTSLPANGGNAATVNGFTVGKNVPSDAVFTDTTYSTGNTTTAGLTKLYTSTGTNTDGTMTQSAIKTALDGKLSTSGTAAKATADASGNTITSTYETKANAITSLSVNGQVITIVKGDGTLSTITTQDTNTDTKVTNTLATTTKAYLTGTTSATTATGTQVFDTGVYLDTTAGTLVAKTFKTASGIEIY